MLIQVYNNIFKKQSLSIQDLQALILYELILDDAKTLVNNYNGYVVNDIILVNDKFELPTELDIYFKLKGAFLTIEEKPRYIKNLHRLHINNVEVFEALYRKILTLKDYSKLEDYILKSSDCAREYNDINSYNLNRICFDNMEDCQRFIDYIDNTFQVKLLINVLY